MSSPEEGDRLAKTAKKTTAKIAKKALKGAFYLKALKGAFYLRPKAEYLAMPAE